MQRERGNESWNCREKTTKNLDFSIFTENSLVFKYLSTDNSVVFNSFTAPAHEISGLKDVWMWGKREIIYLSLHCRHH